MRDLRPGAQRRAARRRGVLERMCAARAPRARLAGHPPRRAASASASSACASSTSRPATSRSTTRTARSSVVLNGEIYNYRELRERAARARGHRFATRGRHRGDRPPLRGARRRLRASTCAGCSRFALWDAPPPAAAARPRPGRQEAALLRAARRRAQLRLGAPRAPPGPGDPARGRPRRARRASSPTTTSRRPLSAFARSASCRRRTRCVWRGRRGRRSSATGSSTTRASASEPTAESCTRRSATRLARGHAAPDGRRRPARGVPLGRGRLLGRRRGDGEASARAGQDLLDRLRRRALRRARRTRAWSPSSSAPTTTSSCVRAGRDGDRCRSSLRHYGEPFADPSAIPSFYLAELTRRHVTVALNGDGGDESFAGYTRYVATASPGRLDRLPRRCARRSRRRRPARCPSAARSSSLAQPRCAGSPASLALDPAERYARYVSLLRRRRARRALHARVRASWSTAPARADVRRDPLGGGVGRATSLDRMLDVDVDTYLPGDLLVKMDIATMAHSLEARSPFLDHELMEFARGAAGRSKVAGGQKKWCCATRCGLAPGPHPRPPEVGFGVPLAATGSAASCGDTSRRCCSTPRRSRAAGFARTGWSLPHEISTAPGTTECSSGAC